MDPKARFNASKVVEILESHGKSVAFSDTPVVTEKTKNNSTGNIQVEGQERTMNANHAEYLFQSFGAAWDYGANVERWSDIEKGWNIGQPEVTAASFRAEKAEEPIGSVSKQSNSVKLRKMWSPYSRVSQTPTHHKS